MADVFKRHNQTQFTDGNLFLILNHMGSKIVLKHPTAPLIGWTNSFVSAGKALPLLILIKISDVAWRNWSKMNSTDCNATIIVHCVH